MIVILYLKCPLNVWTILDIKRFHEELAPAVHDIVRASIKQRMYPKQYKHGLVSPVAKVRPAVCIENDFRQISVLPHMAKAFPLAPAVHDIV